jgi:hypothetical protein
MTLGISIKCHCTECRVLCIATFNVIMLIVVMLNVVMLNVIMLSVGVPPRLLGCYVNSPIVVELDDQLLLPFLITTLCKCVGLEQTALNRHLSSIYAGDDAVVNSQLFA